MVAFSAIYTLPVAVNLPFNWRELKPVAMIALDEFVLWVNAETPYKTPKEYLAAVKAAPPEPSRWAAPAPSARTTSLPSRSKKPPA